MKQVIDYISGVKYELSQVEWPTKDEVIRLTMVVFLISAIVALYVGGLDLLFVKGFEYLIAN